MVCSACSRPLPDGARFCPFCGHQVSGTALEERRVVTVVFADLVGYTALSEHLDPERVKRLVDGAFQRLIAEIERFGGRVDKVLGDGILALFGAPIAHEDDADRAVRAAIEMHRSLTEYVAGQIDGEQRLRLRVGVNTGEVVVGTVSGTDDYTAMGDVVNVASRLQSMAPPGGTYVGSSTELLLSPAIDRVPVADSEVRGRTQTELVWQVTGRSRFPSAFSSPHDFPFVGRTTQRALLASMMRLVVDGKGAVVSVLGEAGSGKTRLVNEALAQFPSRRVVVFAGVCAPYGETNVWAPVANALFTLMETEREVPSSRLREIVAEKGRALYGFDEADPRLQRFVEGAMHLFGHPSELDRVAPSQAREILIQVVVEGIHRRSQGAPCVVWIDDLQWADSLLLELLGRISRSLIDRPVLLITAQRDDAVIDWPPSDDHPITVRMPLDPLTRDEADELVASVFADGVPADLIGHLYERSGGNPLFLTQLAKVAHDHPGDQQLPGTLRALIAARLDALAPGQRRIVDNAAVLGVTGPVKSLEQFAAAMQQGFDPADLDALVDDGLLDIDHGWWRFRSDVVREVSYQTLTKSARAQRHAGTAAIMQRLELAPIDQIAHHAASAAELVADIGPVASVPTDIADRAVSMLAEAAERSIELGAFNHSIRLATRALDLGVADERTTRHLHLLRGSSAVERHETESAEVDAVLALESALAAGDHAHEAIAHRILGVLAQQRGDLVTARAELGSSVDLLREIGDLRELATSLSDRGFVEVFGGSLAEADRILDEAEQLADELGDRRRLAWIRQHQAWAAFLSGDHLLAEERLNISSSIFHDLGDRSGTGWALGLLAYVKFFEQRFVEAEEIAHKVRHEAVALGERWAPAMMDALVASIRLWSGRFTEAEELSRRALVSFRELNDRFGIIQALGPRMRALVALGRTQEAERGLEEAVALGDSFGDLAFPTMAAAGTAAHLGLGQRAVTLGEAAVERMKMMGADASEARTTLALALCQVGDPEQALTVLLDVGIHRPYPRAVRALASAMLGDHDTALGDADLVVGDAGATYLDRVLADVAAAAVFARCDHDQLATERLDAARLTASRAGDVVAEAFATSATIALAGHVEVDSVEHLGQGWHSVIRGLAERDQR